MHKSITILCVAALAATAFSAQAQDLTADEVIQKHIQAKGGQEALDAVETVRMSGTMTMSSPQGQMEAPFTIRYKRPDKVRMEFTIQGNTAIQAYNGDSGWMLMPMMGQTEPQKAGPQQVEQLKNMADFDGELVGYAERGFTAEYLGTEEIEGTEAHKIKLTKEDGDVLYKYLDTSHYLVFKEIRKTQIQGQERKIVGSVGDYKQVGDLVLPHSIETSVESSQGSQSVAIESVQLNPEIDEGIFTMPKSGDTSQENGSQASDSG